LKTDQWEARLEKELLDGSDSRIRPEPNQRIWVRKLNVDLEQQAGPPERITGPTGIPEARPRGTPDSSLPPTRVLGQVEALEGWVPTEGERSVDDQVLDTIEKVARRPGSPNGVDILIKNPRSPSLSLPLSCPPGQHGCAGVFAHVSGG
jgi:hypothetical protein